MSTSFEAALIARPFLVESYEDWSDYPGWSEVTTDEDEPIRFASVAEAQEWIEAQCAADIAERLARWEEAREKHEASVALYERRVAVLEAAGLGATGKYPVIHSPGRLYPKPTADRGKYRVALDGDPCPTCGVRGYGNKADDEQSKANSAPSPSVTDTAGTYGAVTGGNGRSTSSEDRR